MWICSKFGFFSIVKKGEPDTWQVRARRESDLSELLDATDLDAEIKSTPNGDYAFRIIVDRDGLERIFSSLADSIDYPNFKSCIASLPDQKDKLHAYEDFWLGMLKVQKQAKKATDAPRNLPPPVRKADILRRDCGGGLVRMLITLDAFHRTHGHWPTKLRLTQTAYDILKNGFLTPLGLETLSTKLRVTVQRDIENPLDIVAEDDNGLSSAYAADYNPTSRAADKWIWGLSFY
jgi:hypothetical protein